MKGLVIKSTGSWYNVRDDSGTIVECRLKGQLRLKNNKATNPVVVGDVVDFEYHSANDLTGAITGVCERKNYIIRRSIKLSKQTHVIAANLDHAFLIATLAYPRTSTGFIDRFLVTAEAYHIPASVIFNKTDLYNDELRKLHDFLVDLYTGIGYTCYAVSALNGDNMNDVREAVKDKICLFSGHSGVGKSELINSIQPGLNLKTGIISAMHLKGKHTTTFAEMIELKQGGYIIDTPGIKEFGLIDFTKEEVGLFFPEMKELLHHCQYYNCIHVHEPRCAVKTAVENGSISASRYRNYLAIINDEKLEINDWE